MSVSTTRFTRNIFCSLFAIVLDILFNFISHTPLLSSLLLFLCAFYDSSSSKTWSQECSRCPTTTTTATTINFILFYYSNCLFKVVTFEHFILVSALLIFNSIISNHKVSFFKIEIFKLKWMENVRSREQSWLHLSLTEKY
jgi:hypothetical protein